MCAGECFVWSGCDGYDLGEWAECEFGDDVAYLAGDGVEGAAAEGCYSVGADGVAGEYGALVSLDCGGVYGDWAEL